MSIAEKLKTVAENEEKVFTAGKKAEQTGFWSFYQQDGNRTSYDNAFAGVGWTDETFNPKHPIVPTSAYMMFRYAEITKDIFDCIDLSQSTNNGYAFYGAKFKSIRVDVSGVSSLLSVLGQSSATETINLKVSDEGVKVTDCFVNMRGLKNLTIEGVISEGNINIGVSTLLTVESAKSLINALKDISGTDKAYTYKVTFAPATKTLLDAEGATAPNGDTWLNYVFAKGWNR